MWNAGFEPHFENFENYFKRYTHFTYLVKFLALILVSVSLNRIDLARSSSLVFFYNEWLIYSNTLCSFIQGCPKRFFYLFSYPVTASVLSAFCHFHTSAGGTEEGNWLEQHNLALN